MSKFVIERNDLLTFAHEIYREACYGYLDLCEAVTEKMVSNFLKDKLPCTQEQERPILSGFQSWDTTTIIGEEQLIRPDNFNFIGNMSEQF